MPTLQAADLDRFDSRVEPPVQLPASNPQTDAVGRHGWSRRVKRLRAYAALGTLFVVTLSGYAALFVVFDHFVAVGSGG